MRSLSFYLAVTMITLCLGRTQAASPKPNDLFNSGFASGMAGWHGIGEVIYLKPDGTESAVPIKDATPVLKIPLKRTAPREVSEEFTTPNRSPQLHLHFDVCSSADFKRSTRPDDYTQPWKANVTKVTSRIVVPQSDLWVRIGPGLIYRTANASRTWSTIDVIFKKVEVTRDRVISFCVPCGQGFIYLRHPIINE